MTAYRVPAVVAAAELLRALAAAGASGATLSELARTTGRSKSSVHNLLATLCDEALVARLHDTRRFHLGPALVPLGAAAVRGVRPLGSALRHTPGLCAELGLAMAVAQPVGEEAAQVVEGISPPIGMHVGITVGDRYGVFDGAIGKLLLAQMPAERAEQLVREGRPVPHTDRTILDPDLLLEEVARTRERGWAASVGEFNENNAVAVPVHDPSGRHVLLLVALGFPSQLPEERVPEVAARLVELAALITTESGGRPLREVA